MESLPRNLRECVTCDKLALFHGTEAVLLAVAAIPDPVPEEIRHIEDGQGPRVPAILRRMMVGNIDGAVAVRQRNTSEVPEDKHETPLLIVHVPTIEVSHS